MVLNLSYPEGIHKIILENYNGRQRALGRSKDNPTLKDFGYNDNTIRNSKVFQTNYWW